MTPEETKLVGRVNALRDEYRTDFDEAYRLMRSTLADLTMHANAIDHAADIAEDVVFDDQRRRELCVQTMQAAQALKRHVDEAREALKLATRDMDMIGACVDSLDPEHVRG